MSAVTGAGSLSRAVAVLSRCAGLAVGLLVKVLVGTIGARWAGVHSVVRSASGAIVALGTVQRSSHAWGVTVVTSRAFKAFGLGCVRVISAS